MDTVLHRLKAAGDRMQVAVGMGPRLVFSVAWAAGWAGLGLAGAWGMLAGGVQGTTVQHWLPINAFEGAVQGGCLAMGWLLGLGLILSGAYFRRQAKGVHAQAPEISRLSAWRLMLLNYDEHGKLMMAGVMAMMFGMIMLLPLSGWLHWSNQTRTNVFVWILGVLLVVLLRGLWNLRPVSARKQEQWAELPAAVRDRMQQTVGAGHMSVPLIDCALREHDAVLARVEQEASTLDANTAPACATRGPRRL